MRTHTTNTKQNSVDENLLRNVFFHGLDTYADLEKIKRQGFRSDFSDEEGHWQRDGNLGIGIYLSCEWKTALWFGYTLLETTLLPGTRILDVRPSADQKMLNSLKREFGHELLLGVDIRKAIPHNKHLRQRELINLVRHFYHRTWDKEWGKDSNGFSRWPAKRAHASRALDSAVSLLKRAGFHGYGDPRSDNGIVIFAPDRIKLVRTVAQIDPHQHNMLLEPNRLDSITIEELQLKFPSH